MGLDRSGTCGIQFSEPVEFVLRRYAECGFPEAASDIATMLSDDFNETRLAIMGAVVESTPLRRPMEQMLREHLAASGVAQAGSISSMEISIWGLSLTALVFEGSGPEAVWIHGTRCGELPDRPLVCVRGLLMTEMLLYMCQNVLVPLITQGHGRFYLETRAFHEAIAGRTPVLVNEADIVRDFGLRKRRLEPVRDIIRAVLAARGVYRKIPRKLQLDQDLARKGQRIRRMESDNPLLECFSKVEVDSTVDDETFAEMCVAYEVLKGTGIMVLSPEKDVALRIRRFSRRGFSAAYMPRFRDVVIPVSEPGYFVHEYGHALDFCYGNPSRSVEFLPVIAMYRTMVSEAAPDGFDREYYFRPTEVFARSLEVYVMSRAGLCKLQRDVSESPYHPMSVRYVNAVVQYFDSLFVRLC